MSTESLQNYLAQLKLPDPYSHKGQNGKLLIIGGSSLFHAAGKWSLDSASKFVDMVFYSSVPDNNELIHQAKKEFWQGIVLPRTEIEKYIDEADCILIGPGMDRQGMQKPVSKQKALVPLTEEEWNVSTQRVVNYLLAKYPQKKWVVDAGALQMAEPTLFGSTTIITPHQSELDRISYVLGSGHDNHAALEKLKNQGVTTVLKGKTDYIYTPTETLTVEGGNAGMTKGGTGDILAGVIAALFATQHATVAAVAGCVANKMAGDELYKTVGPFFNAEDLVQMIPKVLWEVRQKAVQ